MTRECRLIQRIPITLVAALALFIGCTPHPSKNRRIRLSIDMWVGFGPWVVGQEKGLFANRGIDLEPVVITGTGEKNAAMAAHRVDGRAEGLESIVLASNEGVPGTVVLALDESAGADGIVADSSVRNVNDLSGRRVAFQTGLPGHFFLLYLLHRSGMSERDIAPQIMDSGAAATAFIAGQVDAAVTWEPWLLRAANRDNAHILASTRDHRGVIVDVLAVHPDLLRDHPGDVRALLSGWFDSVRYSSQHRDQANKIMARFFGVPIDNLMTMLEGLQFADLGRNRELFGGSGSSGQLYRVAASAGEIWYKSALLKKAPKQADRIIDATIIRKIAGPPH